MNNIFRVSFQVFSPQGIRIANTQEDHLEEYNRVTTTTSYLWSQWPHAWRLRAVANDGAFHNIPNDGTNLYNYLRALDLDYQTQRYGEALIQVFL